jgi:hypothetical protein
MMAAQNNQGKMVPGSIDLSKESMMNRANQIQQLSKRQEERVSIYIYRDLYNYRI